MKTAIGATAVTAVTAFATVGAILTRKDKAGSTVSIRPRMSHVAGTQIAWGSNGVGRPLLLLSGVGNTMTDWDPALIEALARTRRVLVMDYPGLGLSGAAPGEWSVSAAAGWIADWLGHICADNPPDVLGWGFGGAVAQRLAVEHPANVERLVLASANPGGPSSLRGPSWALEAHNGPSSSDNTYLQTNFPWTPAAQRFGQEYLRRLYTAYAEERYPKTEVPPATYQAMLKAEDDWFACEENLADLRSVAAPALIAAGERDILSPPDNVKLLSDAIPHTQTVFYPWAGHSFLFQQPAHFAKDVLAFLNS